MLGHRLVGQRLEVQRDERAMTHAEVGPPFEQLRAGPG